MTVRLLEEMSTPALEALDRERTAIVLTVSPLEVHGPHLPVGVDAFAARHFAETLAQRLVAARPGWSVVLAPTLHLGSFTFEGVGTVSVRQRVVRDAVIDYGASLARAGFRFIFVANGHGGPGHLNALDEAAAAVSRRHRVTMASITGYLAWEFLRGRYLARIETALGRGLTTDERRAFTEDAHGGWWETSLMLLLRPDLVDDSYTTLPPARYSLRQRLVKNYPLRDGGQGYVGHPSRGDPAFARAATDVLMTEALDVVEALLDGRLRPSDRRSPFFVVPFFRTGFWPTVTAAAAVSAAALGVTAGWLARRRWRS
ncbi:MAG TPA: creatininase family protein [Methylomirabilota bacterium]